MEKTQINEIKARVQANHPNLTFPDVQLEPLWWGRRPTERIAGRHAIVDQNTDMVYNVCTDLYQPVPHEVVIDLVEQAALSMPEFGKPTFKVELLQAGAKLKVEALFKEIDYEIRKGDTINPKIDVFSSYDLGWKFGGRFGAFRLVCSNGMTVGKVFSSFKKRHLTSLDSSELKTSMLSGMSIYSEQTQLWSKWAETNILPEMYENIWEELPFSKAEREKIEALPQAGTGVTVAQLLERKDLTVWDFSNSVSQFATHEIRSEIRRVEIEPDIAKAFDRLV
jgi:hypothetical protein